MKNPLSPTCCFKVKFPVGYKFHLSIHSAEQATTKAKLQLHLIISLFFFKQVSTLFITGTQKTCSFLCKFDSKFTSALSKCTEKLFLIWYPCLQDAMAFQTYCNHCCKINMIFNQIRQPLILRKKSYLVLGLRKNQEQGLWIKVQKL